MVTSRGSEGESARRAECAIRPKFGNCLESAMRRGTAVSVQSALRGAPAAGERGSRQKRSAEGHTHREGDYLSPHPPFRLYETQSTPPG